MTFKGKKAISTSPLYPLEKATAEYLVPKVPGFMDTKFLTLTTFLWGALMIVFYWLSKFNKNYLLLVSVVVLCQWLSDILDGGVGRYRNQGLVRWGFFMDHFLDFFFMCCTVIGLYLFIENGLGLLLIISLAGMFFVSVFLRFGALTTFSTSFHGVSPAELRVLVIISNAVIYF